VFQASTQASCINDYKTKADDDKAYQVNPKNITGIPRLASQFAMGFLRFDLQPVVCLSYANLNENSEQIFGSQPQLGDDFHRHLVNENRAICRSLHDTNWSYRTFAANLSGDF
jgi:hypothetical protein